jgi:TonB-linked SusC/RagA family outer membrane protein
MRILIFTKLFTLLLLFCSMVGFGQNMTVKGRVIDESGAPVVGATVAVRGTNQATSTSDNGTFTITAKKGATLRFSYIGLGTFDQPVNGTDMNVTLARESRALNEVVVTALGIRKEKKALGYSLTEVKGDELTQARTTNIANSLVGKVAGLNIASNVTGPSGSTRISIRGNTAISANNQPLIVVDGVPISNENLGSVGMWGGADRGDGMSSLNPDEIETVTVLKGGTAAALYGSRASNGAILITSKGGGKGQKGGVEFTSNFQVDELLYKKYKDFQYVYGAGDNGLKPISFDPNLNQTNSFGAKLDGSPVIQYDSVVRPYVAHPDNLSKFYNTGFTATNTVAMTGSSDKLSYRFSISDLDNHGIVPNNTFRRDNVSLNLSSTVSSRLSMLLNVKYIKEKNKNRPRVSDSPGNANYTIATLPTSLDVETMKASKYTTAGYEKVWSNNQYVQNPYFATEDYVQHDEKDRFIGSFEPRFNLTDWLYLKARVGFDRFNFRNTDITPTGTGYQLGGGFGSNTVGFNEANSELLLGFNKKVSSDISISAVGGGNLMKQTYNNDSYGGNPFNIPYFYDISNVSPASVTTHFNYVEKRINSVYGSVDFSYKDLFFLNFSARNDWFSALAPGKNSIFYPAVGGSFILSQALRLPEFINYAKLRASWAQVGGGADPYQLSLTYGLSGATGGAPLAQINQSQVPNALLQPFVLTTSEIGYEGRMFNNRLGIDLALYTRNTTKDIVQATISGASGYSSALFNVGKISNKGIELLLNYRAGSTKNFSWEPSFNAAYNKNEIVALYGDLTKLQVAEPRSRTVYVYQEVGRPFADIQGYAFKRDSATDQIIYNKQGLPLSEPLHKFGSGVSPWTLGFTNSFRYKGVGLSFLVDAKFGGYIYSGTNGLAYRYGLHKETLAGRETGVVGQGITEDGKVNTVNVPAETYYQNLYSNFAETFVYSSDFVKLRQVIIDYSFPAKVFSGTPFKSVSLSLVARNLWTIMKHTPNIDPESNYSASNAQGFEFVGLPPTRSLGLNLNLKF